MSKDKTEGPREVSLTRLKKSLPKLIKIAPVNEEHAQRIVMQLMQMVSSNNELAMCSPRSILTAAWNLSRVGLSCDPALGHAYVIPFRVKNVLTATVIYGYRGLIELARRNDRVQAIRGSLVYVNDLWEYENGLNVVMRHKPWWDLGLDSPGELRCGWTVAVFSNGAQQPWVVSRHDIDVAESFAKTKKFWENPRIRPAMQFKTVVKRSSKLWPLSSEFAHALVAEQRAEDDEPQASVAELADFAEDADFIDLQDGEFGMDDEDRSGKASG